MNSSTLAWIDDNSMSAIGIAAMIAVFVSVIVALFVFVARHRQGHIAAWRAYATSRGARFIEREGPWYRRRGPTIRGQRDDVHFDIDHYVVHHGKSSTIYTRVRAACARAGRTELKLRPNGFLAGVGRTMGMEFASTKDKRFDERFAVRSKAGGSVDAVFDAPARERLLDVDKRFTLTIKDGLATLRWHGWERNEARLDAAVAAIVALCRPQNQPLEKVGR
jgi:hypothetical protein